MDIEEVKKILTNHFVLDRPGSKYWVDTDYSMQQVNFAIWCNQNLSSHWYYGHNPGIGFRYWFEKEEDKIMFILKYVGG